MTARITENDIIEGSIISNGSYLKKVATKLGVLASDCHDPYLRKSTCEIVEELLLQEKKSILPTIFEQYPIDCTNTADFDVRKLDEMIGAFEASDYNDVELLTDIISFLETTPLRDESKQPVIDRVQKYIEANLMQDISLSAICDYMNVSKYYLSHLFKSVTGITVTEFRNELRITAAKNMLINSQKSIDEIAEAVGFSTAAYFTELFTRSEMIPPSKYRKYHQR